MQLYYIITKYDTEQIRFQHTEVKKFSQTHAKGFDSYSAAKKALEEEYAKFYRGCELVEVERSERGTLKRAVFNESHFLEDNFGNRSKSTIEIFLAKAVV